MPERIQLKRTKGWKKSEGAVVVSRPTKWGNPFVVQARAKGGWEIRDMDRGNIVTHPYFHQKVQAVKIAVMAYRHFLVHMASPTLDLSDLRGKDLACWCALDKPCHADVLLEFAALDYPPNWKEVATQVKDDAGWRCIRCGHPNEKPGAGNRIPCDGQCDLARHPEVREAHYITSDGESHLVTNYSRQKQRVLTVHHLDGNKWNLKWWDLTALCQVCHLIIQAKVNMFRPWAMFEHSEWFKPYVAGFYAYRYNGELLSRQEVMERMSELLALEGPLTFPTWGITNNPTVPYIDPEQNFMKE